MNSRGLFLGVALAFSCAAGIAQDTQKQAELLIDRARQLSDIRSANAPAFRLKATFSFVGVDLETVQGTYTEVWVSNKQWYRETAGSDWRRVEVGDPTRRWQIDTGKDIPEEATRVQGVMEAVPSKLAHFEFETIANNTYEGRDIECAVSKSGSRQQKSAFCFEKKSGAMVEKVYPEVRPRNVVEYSCMYGGFQKFGEHWFPREMACFEDRHKKMDAKVIEISAEPAPDPALFVPPPGAVELGNCLGHFVAPQPVSTLQPLFHAGADGENVSVLVSAVIDIKGKPQSVKAIRSAQKNFDQSAINSVRGWRFRPATCDGAPIPAQIYVEVRSTAYY